MRKEYCAIGYDPKLGLSCTTEKLCIAWFNGDPIASGTAPREREKIMSTDKLFARILPYAETHTEGERERARARERESEKAGASERARARVRERERERVRERERERDEDAGRKRPATGKFFRYRFRL